MQVVKDQQDVTENNELKALGASASTGSGQLYTLNILYRTCLSIVGIARDMQFTAIASDIHDREEQTHRPSSKISTDFNTS